MSPPSQPFQRYHGDGRHQPGRTSAVRDDSGHYLASPALATAVNTALAAERPLLLTGEPGTGKTSLAYAVADELALGEVLPFAVRSDSVARDVLYVFDHLRRLYDAQARVPGSSAEDPKKYITPKALGLAIEADTPRVVLIDEIDKAPRDFPNDLLSVLDEMDYEIVETGERRTHKVRPVVVITSNVERNLPEPFLRRCVYHHIAFPDGPMLRRILVERLGKRERLDDLAEVAVKRFLDLRTTYGADLRKKPATAELLVWVRVLLQSGTAAADVSGKSLADLYPGTLLKTKEDLERVLGTAG